MIPNEIEKHQATLLTMILWSDLRNECAVAREQWSPEYWAAITEKVRKDPHFAPYNLTIKSYDDVVDFAGKLREERRANRARPQSLQISNKMKNPNLTRADYKRLYVAHSERVKALEYFIQVGISVLGRELGDSQRTHHETRVQRLKRALATDRRILNKLKALAK